MIQQSLGLLDVGCWDLARQSSPFCPGQYFKAAERNRGTRFNWYRDGSDWKPFHHDSAP